MPGIIKISIKLNFSQCLKVEQIALSELHLYTRVYVCMLIYYLFCPDTIKRRRIRSTPGQQRDLRVLDLS